MTDSYSLRAYVFTTFAGQESREIRFTTSKQGVGQFYNPAQREKPAYLGCIQYNLSPSRFSPQNYVLQSLQHFTKIMITEKVKPNDYRKAEHKLGYIDIAPYRGYCHIGLIVSTPFRWALFLLHIVTILFLIIN